MQKSWLPILLSKPLIWVQTLKSFGWEAAPVGFLTSYRVAVWNGIVIVIRNGSLSSFGGVVICQWCLAVGRWGVNVCELPSINQLNFWLPRYISTMLDMPLLQNCVILRLAWLFHFIRWGVLLVSITLMAIPEEVQIALLWQPGILGLALEWPYLWVDRQVICFDLLSREELIISCQRPSLLLRLLYGDADQSFCRF